MTSKKQVRQSTTGWMPRTVHALLAAAVLGLAVTPIAFAGASSGPVATKSASLTRQVKSLKRRVAALENKQTTQTTTTTGTTATAPTGPAGGDLTGTYPNPTIGADTVTTGKVLNDSLSGFDIAPDSLTAADLAAASVGTDELGGSSVGAQELKSVSAVVGTGISVPAGTSNTAYVTCPGGRKLIAGGYAWGSDQAGTSVIASAPSDISPDTTWVVTGHATQNNTLYPWASCLAVTGA